MKHSKLPWRVAESRDGFFVACGSNPISPEKFLSKEDAAYIVRACNDHEGLLEACKMALVYAEKHFEFSDEIILKDYLRAAIRAAEGE